MVDGFAVINFYESTSRASDVFEIEHAVFEFDFSVVARNTLVENKYLVGTVPANLGPFLFD